MRLVRGRRSISIDFGPLEQLGDQDVDAITDAVAEGVMTVVETASRDLAGMISSRVSAEAARRSRFRKGFEARLRRSWKKPLEMYDVTQGLCTELGSDLNSAYRPMAAAAQDFKFEALTRLHGRACLTGSEIGALLRSGHATGANARWRTLHELAVVAMLISERDQDVAKRYVEHDFIARSRAALQYQQYAERLGHEPLMPEEVEDANRAREQLVERYGPAYESDYGWAAQALGNTRPRFVDLARSIQLEHWAPYIRLASDAIHAGPHGSFFDIGLHPLIEAIPAGASHFGLADPGANALISLQQVTIALMVHCLRMSEAREEPLKDSFRERFLLLVKMKSLQSLVDEADTAFLEVHEKQEAGGAHLGEPPRILEIASR